MNVEDYQSLGELFATSLTQHPDLIGLIEVNRDRLQEKLTYKQIHEKALHVTKLMQNHGTKPDTHIGILMGNQSKWNISAIGIFYTGAILVPLDYKLTPQEQIALIQHADLHALVIEYPLWARMMKLDEVDQLKNMHIFVTEVPDNKDIGFAQKWNQDTSHLDYKIIQRDQHDIATIVYSSGTYGRAKGCMLTHQNYLYQGQMLAALFPVDQNDTYFSFIPTNHAIDFMCGFVLPLANQSKTIHQRTLRPEFIASTITNYQVTHMSMVPLLLKNLQVKLEKQFSELPTFKRYFVKTMMKLNRVLTKKKPRYQISKTLLGPVHKKFGGHLQYIFVGGAFVDPDMAQFFYDLGFSVVIGYGLTEAGTVLTVNDLHPFRKDTVGKPLPFTKIEIRNPNISGIGEVWAQGPTVMKGYYKDMELTQETIQDDWLYTGDIGYLKDGHLILKGRKKNMIVTSGGKNIYPEDIEHYFSEINADEFCVLAGSYIWPQEEKYRDDLFLIIYTDQNDLDTLRKQVKTQNQKLPDHKRISYLLWIPEELPKTATMKIKRPLLASKIAANQYAYKKVSL